MKRKTILFLIDGLPGGGAERVVVTLAGGMAEEGHDVTIVSLRSECAYPLPQDVDFHIVEDRYQGPFRRQTEIRRRARALDQALDKIFSGKKIDLAVSYLPKTDRIVAASSYLRDPWFSLQCAFTVGELTNKTGWNRWRKKRQLVKTYSGKKLITVSTALQEDIRSLGIRPAQMKCIHNSFDLKKIRAAAQEKSPFEGKKYLLHVGRFHPQKRHDRLFEAFKISGYPGKLILLGDGTAEEKLFLYEEAKKQGITKEVIFAGFSSNPYAAMRGAEALVLSSDYEGLPSVLIEALASGTQVVSTKCPYGPEEILCGPLAQGLADLTPASLAAAIKRVLASPVTITDEMVAPFTLEQVMREYLELTT